MTEPFTIEHAEYWREKILSQLRKLRVQQRQQRVRSAEVEQTLREFRESELENAAHFRQWEDALQHDVSNFNTILAPLGVAPIHFTTSD
jgi:hypothetical protein